MQNRNINVLWLICGLALSGCATSGKVVCPTLPPIDPALMQSPETERKVRRELFEPPAKLTNTSAPSKPSS